MLFTFPTATYNSAYIEKDIINTPWQQVHCEVDLSFSHNSHTNSELKA
jgi:hypothetical protein